MNPNLKRGPFWTPITPPRGSFFHAESQVMPAPVLFSHHGWMIGNAKLQVQGGALRVSVAASCQPQCAEVLSL